MAGPRTKINYIDDFGSTVAVPFPSWMPAFTGDAAATVTTVIPKGVHPRYRLLRGDTTGKEYRVHVGDITKVSWTTAPGAVVASPPTIPGATDTTFTYGGRIGERTLIRGWA